MDSKTKERTRAEWRELGFFYDRDDAAKEWVLVGSRDGLLRFAHLIHKYVADPRNAMKSEHEHYGPYMYLEVMTWPEAGMDDHSIHGTPADLKRLALIVENPVATMDESTVTRIRDEFAPDSAYATLWFFSCDQMISIHHHKMPTLSGKLANMALQADDHLPRFARSVARR
jgi:hypothetical protein